MTMMKPAVRSRAAASAMLAGALALWGLAADAQAEERVLRAGTFLPASGVWHEPFKDLVESINENGEGLLRVEIVADPAAMNPFQMGEALSNGVIDLLNISGAFYTNLVPEGDATKLFNRPMSELRENGAIALLDEIHRAKMNATFLTRWGEGVPYHVYTKDDWSEPSLAGRNMRGIPLYRPYLEALGANIVQMTGSEIYPAMEAGVVDGYAWPLWGIGDLGLLEVTGHRLDPGFYSAAISILMNAEVYDSLSEAQRNLLDEQILAMEDRFASIRDEISAVELRKQDEADIRSVTFSEEENLRLRRMADEAGWKTLIDSAPEHGPRLRELTYRELE